MNDTLARAALAVALLLVLPGGQAARPSYSYSYSCELLDSNYWGGSGRAINAAGEVAGWNAGAARWSRKGRRTDLEGLIDGESSDTSDINRAGRIVGYSGSFGFPGVPTVWDGDAPPFALPLLPGGSKGEATTLNDAGLIAGTSTFDGGEVMHAVVWEGGMPVDLGTLGDKDAQPGRRSFPLSVNQAGEVVGLSEVDDEGRIHAVYWGADRRIIDLGTLPGATESSAQDINSTGTVVGSARFTGEPSSSARPVIWVDQAIRALALRPGQRSGSAVAINASGQIVGLETTRMAVDGAEFSFIGTALLWPGAEHVAIDLNTVTQRCTNNPRAFFAERLVNATDINDKGVILARFQGLERSRGWYFRPARLTPLP